MKNYKFPIQKEMSTELGTTPNGENVTAATDAAGSQVIVKSDNVHLLSRPLKDHQAAIELGQHVVDHGSSVYDQWFDLKQGGVGLNLFAIFGGEFRRPEYDDLNLQNSADLARLGEAIGIKA